MSFIAFANRDFRPLGDSTSAEIGIEIPVHGYSDFKPGYW